MLMTKDLLPDSQIATFAGGLGHILCGAEANWAGPDLKQVSFQLLLNSGKHVGWLSIVLHRIWQDSKSRPRY